MNAYEYQLYTEFVDQLAQLTYLTDTYCIAKTENLFLDAIGEGVALGIEANKKHEPVIATRWANFGWEVLEIAKGIGEGVVLGACNTVSFAKNIVCHPIRTTNELIHGFGTIICAIGKAVGVPVQLGVLCITGNAEQACKESQKIYEQTKFLMQECATKIAAMSNREIAKQTTAFATDWCLTGKALTLGHSICSRARPFLAEVIKVLRKEPALQYAVAGADGVLHHISETAKNVGGAAKEVVKDLVNTINQTSEVILKNGYYEVNGFKFSEFYYERLWSSGRNAPSLIAREILESAKNCVPDIKKRGFFRYEVADWEMIYNPITKEVWHLQPIKRG
jgi:hypothetical protein